MSGQGPSRRRRIAGERSRTSAPADQRTQQPGKPAPAKRPGPASRSGKPAPKSHPKQGRTKEGRPKESRPKGPRIPGGGPRLSALRPPRHALRWFVPLVLLAVIAVVFAVVMGVRGISDYSEANGVEETRNVAASEGGQAAETIFSFKYDKLDAHLKDSQALMTDSFASEFEKIAPALTELAPQRKIDVEATTRNAAVEECGEDCSPDKATVLVFFDQSRTMPDSKLPTVFGQRVEISMTKQSGQWLVDDIKAL